MPFPDIQVCTHATSLKRTSHCSAQLCSIVSRCGETYSVTLHCRTPLQYCLWTHSNHAAAAQFPAVMAKHLFWSASHCTASLQHCCSLFATSIYAASPLFMMRQPIWTCWTLIQG